MVVQKKMTGVSLKFLPLPGTMICPGIFGAIAFVFEGNQMNIDALGPPSSEQTQPSLHALDVVPENNHLHWIYMVS